MLANIVSSTTCWRNRPASVANRANMVANNTQQLVAMLAIMLAKPGASRTNMLANMLARFQKLA